MRYMYQVLLTFLLFTFSHASFANDILIPFGGSMGASAPAWKYRGGNTNLDAELWKTLLFSEAAWATGGSALGFASNAAPVRSTTIPLDATTNSGGSAAGSPYATMYFRKTINIASLAAYTNFQIRTQFDDAIVVWINGVEAYRSNIVANPAFATFANGTNTTYNNGYTIFTTAVANSMMVVGNNIIAVEIHQNTSTSSDLFFDLELSGITASSSTLTRGPYLQVGSQTGVTVRWRTDVATNSRVTWGSSFGTYPNIIDSTDVTTEHIVRISGLTADTKYYYTIGSTTQTLQAANTNYVLTAPPSNNTRKLRFSAIGDCGNASSNQVDTKNALLSYIGANDIDATILLGDNAYGTGTDNEFQSGFFDIYKDDLLKNKKLYPAPGNHDYGNSSSNTGNVGNTVAASMPYHKNFSLPTAGECGGVASNSKAYYSFDIGNVHFLSLDSYGQQDANTTKLYDTLGAQVQWIKNDLAANTKKWTVVFFHHPPYTKTSHNSDTEGDLESMRENFIRILERNGVDLVLNGHSHGYERSFLLKNYYKANASSPSLTETDFNIATHTATGNNQNGKYDGTANACAYTYNSGKYNHGSMYVVAGSAGQIGGVSPGYPHNAMYYSNNTEGGSLYFEVDSNRLNAKFISYTGTGAGVAPFIRDEFTIFKDVNKITNVNVTVNTPSNLKASWKGNYIWPTNGNVTTSVITVPNSVIGTFTYRVKDAASANCLEDVFNVTVTGTVPVSLLSFDARTNNSNVLINWSTSQELNNKSFTIEKSTDGINFYFLGKVDAAINSSITNNYSLTDIKPADGVNYYRLSQTNADGRFTYLGVKKVNYNGKQSFYVSISKASNNNILATINCQKSGWVSMLVVDMMGKEILTENFKINAGTNTKNLTLQNGLYVLVLVDSKGEKINAKIVVQ